MKASSILTPRSTIVVALLLAGALAAGGCGVPSAGGQADSFGLDLAVPAQGLPEHAERPAGVVVFLVDGVNARIFREMLDAGELPQIKHHFVDRGLYAPAAAANIPSITLVNLTAIVTGQLPGHHGVLGNNWFDRDQRLYRDYETIAQKNTLDGDYTAPTLFEHTGENFTASIFYQPHRGVTRWWENWTSAGPPFYFGWFEFVDRLTLYRLGELADLAREKNRWPSVTYVYLLAPDFRAYESGVSSQQYRDAIAHTDRQIGRVLGDFQRAGLYEDLTFILTSDHGLGEVAKHWSLEDRLESLGLRVADKRLWETTDPADRKEYYNAFPAVTYGSGDRYKALCLQKPRRVGNATTITGNWTARPSGADLLAYPVDGKPLRLPQLLAAEPAVDAVAYAPAPNSVRVLRADGEVEFTQPEGRGGNITCRIVSGNDPFGWRGTVSDEMLSGAPASPRAWLEATIATNFPDLAEPLLAYFRASRRGDIVLFAAPGWDFGKVNRAGHGGLRPSEMHVPILLAGPGVPRGTITSARSIDVPATVLHLLGLQQPPDMDGRTLLQKH